MSSTLELAWFARHEICLAWRDWLSMMTAGRKRRTRNAVIGLVVFAALMHLPAYAIVGRYADMSSNADQRALVVITASLFLAWALILSQAMELVTRVLLFPRRSRSHHVVAGNAGECLFNPHGSHRLRRNRDGAAAVRAIHRRAGADRRTALAGRLWRDRGIRHFGGGRGDRADDRAVSYHRTEAHAAGCASPCRHHRGRAL